MWMFSFEHCQLLTQGEDLKGRIASTAEEDSQCCQDCRNEIEHKFLVCSMRKCPMKSPFVERLQVVERTLVWFGYSNGYTHPE